MIFNFNATRVITKKFASDPCIPLTIFDSVVKNAVALEAHTERYSNRDSNIDRIYTLVGAFENGSGIVPVRLTVKNFTDGNNPTLHVVVAQSPIDADKKKRTGVMV